MLPEGPVGFNVWYSEGKSTFPPVRTHSHITMEFSYLGPKFESLNHMLPEKPSGRHGDQASGLVRTLDVSCFIYSNVAIFHLQ